MYSIIGTHCYINTLGKQFDGSTDRLAFEQKPSVTMDRKDSLPGSFHIAFSISNLSCSGAAKGTKLKEICIFSGKVTFWTF